MVSEKKKRRHIKKKLSSHAAGVHYHSAKGQKVFPVYRVKKGAGRVHRKKKRVSHLKNTRAKKYSPFPLHYH